MRYSRAACPYGVENCERCTNSISCEKCCSGYYGLREGETRASPYRCVRKCPQGWVPEAVAGHGQRCKLLLAPPTPKGKDAYLFSTEKLQFLYRIELHILSTIPLYSS